MDEDHEARFVGIETKVAFAERLMDQLSDVIADQAKLIDGLERRLAKLEGHLRESVLEKPGNERPPHY